MGSLTIRLDDKLDAELTRLARRLQRSKSELVRDMLRRETALAAFEDARRRLVPLGEKAGYLTDEDLFRDLS